MSCSIGPFLAAAGVALRSGELGTGLATFAAYAVGMGLVVAVLAVAAALASTAVVTSLRRALPYVTRIGGALLVVTGAYVAYYGYYELRLFHADQASVETASRGASASTACGSRRPGPRTSRGFFRHCESP